MRLVLVLLVVQFLLGVAPAAADNVLRRGHHDEPESLDPDKTDGSQEFWIESDLFEPLVIFDAHGRLVPGAAKSWEVAPDGLSWTFHLRDGLMWSDGTPLGAEDFVWSFRRVLDPATAAPYASILYPIVGAQAFNEGSVKDPSTIGITAPDSHTVRFALTQPTAFLDGIISLQIGMPLPRHVIEAWGSQWTRAEHIVGNGAFIMKSWTPQQDIVLARNPHYWDAASVKLDGVRWITIGEDETSMRRFKAGEVDIARAPTRDVRQLRKDMPDQLHTDTSLWTVYLIVNTQKKPLDDPRIRQALSMTIDRDVLADKIDVHGEAPALALVPPGMAGYVPQQPDWAGLSMAERRARAKDLLAAAGVGPATPITIDLIFSSEDMVRLDLDAIAHMWAPLGVKVVLDGQENQVVTSAIRDHQSQLGYYGWVADYPDPWTFLSILDSRAGPLNTPDYRNPEFDALLDTATHTLDPAARLRVLEAAERLEARDQPFIPLFYNTTPTLVSPRVKGYYPNPFDLHLGRDLALDP